MKRNDAIALAEVALKAYRQAGEGFEERVSGVQAWLEDHPSPSN